MKKQKEVITKKLDLNNSYIKEAREMAKKIALKVQNFIDQHTTTTIERTICRLFGIDGVNEFDVPLPNIIVDKLEKEKLLGKGVATFIGNAMIYMNLKPQLIAEKMANNDFDLSEIPSNNISAIKKALNPIIEKTIEKILNNKKKRESFLEKYGEKTDPLIYVIVATGNIYEDIVQAKAAAN